MSQSGVVTTGLSKDLIAWLDCYAKSMKQSKRSIFEEALRAYRHQKKKETFQKGFQRVAMDQEMLELAEMGLGDYNDQLNEMGL